MAQVQVGEIRDDVPVPEDCQGDFKFPTNGRPMQLLRYRIEQMQISQSITVSNSSNELRRKFKDKVRQSAAHAGRKLNRTYTARWTTDTDVTIWRLS